MAVKRKADNGASLAKLKKDLAQGDIGKLYLFYGEETYLRDFYLDKLQKAVIGDDTDNLIRLDGCASETDQSVKKTAIVPQLIAEIEGYPMFAEKKMITVWDFDIYGVDAKSTTDLEPCLSNLPDYVCIVIVYGGTVPGEEKKNKKLEPILAAAARRVEFGRQSRPDLVKWVQRRFEAEKKRCGEQEALYLLDLTGGLMRDTIPEIAKVAAYARQEQITRGDIDAVATPVRETVIFRMTDAVAARSSGTAIALLEQLLRQGTTDEMTALQMLCRTMRQLYAARISLDAGEDSATFAAQMRINRYVADNLQMQARRFRPDALRNAVRLCFACEQSIFSAPDKQVALDTLITELCLL